MVAAVVMQHSRPSGSQMKGNLAKQHSPLHEHHLSYSKLWGEKRAKKFVKNMEYYFLYVLPHIPHFYSRPCGLNSCCKNSSAGQKFDPHSF